MRRLGNKDFVGTILTVVSIFIVLGGGLWTYTRSDAVTTERSEEALREVEELKEDMEEEGALEARQWQKLSKQEQDSAVLSSEVKHLKTGAEVIEEKVDAVRIEQSAQQQRIKTIKEDIDEVKEEVKETNKLLREFARERNGP